VVQQFACEVFERTAVGVTTTIGEQRAWRLRQSEEQDNSSDLASDMFETRKGGYLYKLL